MANDTRDVALLLRRAGFGSTPAERARAAARGFEVTASELVARARTANDAANARPEPRFSTPIDVAAIADPTQRQAAIRDNTKVENQESAALSLWWVERMTLTDNPLREKAAFVLHDHFATSVDKVRRGALMYRQYRLLRDQGLGNFETLVQALAIDPAMLLWLDGNDNVAKRPNENFARELFELFALGVGHYSEQDIKEAARAFTGWAYNRKSDAVALRPKQHDTGIKTVLGTTGNLDSAAVVRIATHRVDAARHLAAKWWSRLAYPVGQDDPVLNGVASSFAATLDTGALVQSILLHDAFRSSAARTGLVKTPVEYVVGTLRAFGVAPTDVDAARALRELGQVPFRPPSVGGWPQNEAWLTTATAVTRAQFAGRVVAKANLKTVNDAAAASRPQVLADLLGVDAWSDATAAVLRAQAKDVKTVTALALIAPEYQVN